MFETRLRREDGSLVEWPERDLKITAVDADSGSFRVFDRTGDVDLVHAVAASCAVPLVWPAVEIGGRHYVDGGMRSAANADLATGCDVVLAVVPLWRALSRHHAVPEQLRRTGARRTAWINPDRESLTAIGRDVLDPRSGWVPPRPAPPRAAGWRPRCRGVAGQRTMTTGIRTRMPLAPRQVTQPSSRG